MVRIRYLDVVVDGQAQGPVRVNGLFLLVVELGYKHVLFSTHGGNKIERRNIRNIEIKRTTTEGICR